MNKVEVSGVVASIPFCHRSLDNKRIISYTFNLEVGTEESPIQIFCICTPGVFFSSGIKQWAIVQIFGLLTEVIWGNRSSTAVNCTNIKVIPADSTKQDQTNG